MGDWATLPKTVLSRVVQHLVVCQEDVISFRGVCKSWNSATLPILLMLPEDQQKEEIYQQISSRRNFFSLSALQVYGTEMTLAIGRKCLGTFNGWFLTVDVKRNNSPILLRPFSKEAIKLPRLFSFKGLTRHTINLDTCVVKVAMSGNPRDVNNPIEKFVVVAIARDHPVLAYATTGDEVWTMYPYPPDGVSYYDVAYYKGAFHAVDKEGALLICDLNVNKIGPRVITAPVAPPRKWKQMYLIESSPDLLLVYRTHIRRCDRKVSENSLRRSTAGFVVYKLEEVYGIGEYPYKWTEVKNLRGRTLFLGGDVSVSSFSFKRAKPNCIYFAEDGPEKYPGGYDTRVYNMKNNLAQVLYYSGS